MRSAAWACARRFPFSRSANPKAVRRAANARAWQAEPAAAHVPVDLPVRVRGVPNGKVVHPPFQVPIQLSNQGRDRLETLTGHFRFPIEAESGSLALRLACAPIPMLRQMGCSIPRLLGYMSEQAIYIVNSFQFRRSAKLILAYRPSGSVCRTRPQPLR